MTGLSLGQRDRPYVAEHSDHSSNMAWAHTGHDAALTGAQDRCEHSGDAVQPVSTADVPPLWAPRSLLLPRRHSNATSSPALSPPVLQLAGP